jgi:hypothetical protein
MRARTLQAHHAMPALLLCEQRNLRIRQKATLEFATFQSPPRLQTAEQPQPNKSNSDVLGEQHKKEKSACGPTGAGAAGGCCASRATRPVGIRAVASSHGRRWRMHGASTGRAGRGELCCRPARSRARAAAAVGGGGGGGGGRSEGGDDGGSGSGAGGGHGDGGAAAAASGRSHGTAAVWLHMLTGALWRWGGGRFHAIRRFFFSASSRESHASAFPLRGRKGMFFRASDSNHKSVYSDPTSARPTMTADRALSF